MTPSYEDNEFVAYSVKDAQAGRNDPIHEVLCLISVFLTYRVWNCLAESSRSSSS